VELRISPPTSPRKKGIKKSHVVSSNRTSTNTKMIGQSNLEEVNSRQNNQDLQDLSPLRRVDSEGTLNSGERELKFTSRIVDQFAQTLLPLKTAVTV
jgi:hypothetical protein